MCCRLLAAAVLLLSFSFASPAATPEKGAVVLEDHFDRADATLGWAGQARTLPGRAGTGLFLTNGAAEASSTVTRRINVAGLPGCTLGGSIQVKASQVSAKPNPWNGIKAMLVVQGPSGVNYPQADLEVGSFDWTRARFSARIPEDATNVSLVLGLEKVTGSVCFDDLKIIVAKVPRTAPPAVAGPRWKGHNHDRLRGTMISPRIDAAGLRTLGGEWKANLIRWQLIRTQKPGEIAPLEAYDAWLDQELARLDAALPLCKELGMLVVLDLHSPPGGKGTAGGYAGSDARLFTDPACQGKFVEVWRKMARKYRGETSIWGFDLVNEPVDDVVEEGCEDWQDLAERTGRAVREIDPARTLIIEPAHWGGPGGFRDLYPLSLTNVVYSFHMYEPGAFTHQGVHKPGPALVYPGEIQGKYWDRAALLEAMRPAIEFQQRYNVHLYVGEFSAIRWAPENSAYRYLKDVISLFEEQGWDWSYHAFREWSGWSVEHSQNRADTKPTAQPDDRQKLLREWFAKNR
jgi:hypothetical protein